MQKNINLPAEATQVIAALQHKNGTYHYYRETLNRLWTYILHQSDEIGMSDTETLHTLRVLNAIGSDLAAIAGPVATAVAEPATTDEIAERLDDMFAIDDADDELQDPDSSEEPGEPRELLAALKRTMIKADQLCTALSKAIDPIKSDTCEM